MHLSDHDLRQFDDAYLETLTSAQARALLGKALADLKAARERLGQNPSNSSRPPSTRLPWEGVGGQETPAGESGVPGTVYSITSAAEHEISKLSPELTARSGCGAARRVGRIH
jgi:hypothetical protein